jgi:CDP-glycerol glycerophosphotransferase
MSASPGVLQRARRAAGRFRSRHFAPLVTVIVPVYQAEAYLDACLSSVRAQTHERLQVVVVDDGSTDGSRTVYERHAAQDDRIEVVRQDNHGLGAARNAGIARARGEYLTFLDADDMLPAHAYRTMVASLEETGSDFATGAVLRVHGGRRSTPAWIREVHAVERRGIRIDDFPRAVMDVIACNRMFRTEAWHRLGLTFPEGVAYEDHVPMMAAYVRGRFDVLRETTYHWRIREDRTSIGQQKHTVANLMDRLEAKRAARAVVEAEASPTVVAAWQARVLDMDLRLFIDEVPGVDAAYWDVLRAGVREHVERATPQAWADVRVEQRIRAWLVAEDHRPELEDLLRRGAAGDEVVHARVEQDRVVARVEVPEAARPPAELLEVGERELELQVSLRAVSVDGDALVLVLAPRVGPLDEGLESARLVVRLRDAWDRTVELPVPPAPTATAARLAVPLSGSRWPDLRELRLPASALPEGAASWDVETEYAVGDRRFTSGVTTRDPDGSAGRPPAVSTDGRRMVPTWHRRSGLAIDVTDDEPGRPADGPPPVRPLLVVDDAELTIERLELRGTWHGTPPGGEWTLQAESQRPIPVELCPDGTRTVLSARWDEPPAHGVWRLRPTGSASLWVAPELLARLPLVVARDGVRLGVIRDTDEAPALRVVVRRS